MNALLRTLFILALTATVLPARWETLEGCRLVSSSKNDGDSFVVSHDGEEYHFRLYFVDTPETGLFYPERVEDQANYFDTDLDTMLRIGERSEDFARRFLSGRFTVHTQWTDAMGTNKRYAAVIYNRHNESLIEALVDEGYARIKGFRPASAWPGGESATDNLKMLARLERAAQREKAGAWRNSTLRTDKPSLPGKKDPSIEATSEVPRKVDLNQASIEALISVPGIGPIYAERILEQRPFITISDLQRVHGIGRKTVEKLRPYLTLSLPDSFKGTAIYYLADPEHWANKSITLHVSGFKPLGIESPDNFTAFEATTGSETINGAALPLYLHNDRVSNAMDYFAQTSEPIALEVYFFRYEGKWVTVLREN